MINTSDLFEDEDYYTGPPLDEDMEDFGTRRLERLTFDEILDRYGRIKALTHFEDV